MAEYLMKERTLSLDDSWDVIVVGGGPSGCTAATAAAREGAKTLLVEATGALGGMGTSGLVPAWCPFTDREKIIYKGLAEKVLMASKNKVPHENPEKLDWVSISPEDLKIIYDDMVTEAGVKVLFNTLLSAVDSDREPGAVSSLLMSNKSGLKAYSAKVYIDCTGDADLAVWAGAEYEKGDEQGEMQPVTHCFILSNVDSYAFLTGPQCNSGNPESPAWKIARDKKYDLFKDCHFCLNHLGPGTVGFNAGHQWQVDNTDPDSITESLMTGRKLAVQIRDGLAEYYPEAFANAYLVATANLMGVRETRRIIGDYILTVDDWLERKRFADEVCMNSYFIDIHTGADEIEKSIEDGENPVAGRFQAYKPGESHGIPYRCLAPKGIKNVLVAGRSISTDRIVQGSTRVMPVCLAMGEAAGIAAEMAAKNGNDVHSVDTDELRKKLKSYGAYLPD